MPETRHTILRFRFNHLKTSVIFDTWPKMMKLAYPNVRYKLNKSDWFAELWNGSQILFGGLDDKERTEKILGQEHSTIYLNECSQISYDARNKVVTRLAQKSGLKLKAYYDLNPPTRAHWTYKLFEENVEPKSGEKLSRPQDYASLLMNPGDNLGNLGEGYLEELAALPAKDRMRFLEGRYLAQVDNAMWTADLIGRRRERQWITEAERQALINRMRRIVVAVDPSGCAGEEDKRSDEIGICVVGIDRDNIGYLLADLSGRYSPEGWARKSVDASKNWRADRIVAERNFGGALVESNIRSVERTAPVTLVTASRGKTQRAEPIAAFYEQGLVVHAGHFPDLEEQLCLFSTNGYAGTKSPDRADAMIWGFSDLMLTGSTYDSTMSWVTGAR
jgi:hypothetical protein